MSLLRFLGNEVCEISAKSLLYTSLVAGIKIRLNGLKPESEVRRKKL